MSHVINELGLPLYLWAKAITQMRLFFHMLTIAWVLEN